MDKETILLIKGSIEKAEDKLHSAEILLINKEFEDTVSRAYYCCFHAAQGVLISEGLNARTHQGVVNMFGLHFVKTGKFAKKLGKFLADLKDERENSDYELFSGIDEETAKHAVEEAKEFLQEVKKYFGNILM